MGKCAKAARAEKFLKVIILAGAMVAARPAALAQQPPNGQARSLDETVRALQEEMGKLTVSLHELRAEVDRSRQESVELRHELNDTREKLASLMDPVRAQTVPVALAATRAASPPEAKPLADPPASSTEERIAKLEEDHQLLSTKVDEQFQTKVESASKYRVKLSGIALFNMFETRGQVDNQDVPSFAREMSPLESSGNFGATLRQTELGLEIFGPNLGNARTSADLQLDFAGGFPNTWDGVTAGIVRLRTARVHFDWNRTSIVAGQDAPFISPLSPTSLASLAIPALAYAGNLWTWTPQLRVEHRFQVTDASNFVVQGGILDPLTGQPPYGGYYRRPDAGELSGQPAYATRLAWTRATSGVPFAIGVGGYYARQKWGFGRDVDAWAGTADWSIPLGRWFSLTGEFYRGRALGGLGGSSGTSILFLGSLANPATVVQGLNTAGGWTQIKFQPIERLEFNTAYGEDVPSAKDLNYYPGSATYFGTLFSRNESGFFNVIYHARSNILLSAEYRHLRTSVTSYEGKDSADHFNLGIGVLF